MFACTSGAGHFHPMVPFIDACRRDGHEVLVIGPPPLAETVQRAGYPWWVGAAPPEDELGQVWARVPGLSYDDAEQLVIGTIFATLNVRAMLPATRAAVREWRPDVIVREPAEFASAVVAEEASVPHAQVAIGLVATQQQMLSIASDAVETWSAGLTDAIAQTPSLTLFPASLEDPAVVGTGLTHRFRDPAADAPRAPLQDWWAGDDRPLVYVTFGSVTASVPTAAPIYDVAFAAVAELPARVLLTTGAGEPLAAPGPHVHVERWVPQADVLAHARVVVCHGGAGTTLGALAAGVPLVVTPLFADQPHNGRRVAAAGAALLVEPHEAGAIRSAVDPAELRAAIDTVLGDVGFERAAGDIAAEIRALPEADDALPVLAALT
ncbi:MAG: Putative glycosyltransferase [uncultured Solirubrobacteraceae bacterium]|uniref:Glycosyltransferase n=1 Tax=uncultured Solirubrobacteraceae bacterium TaxID=1162706 RepID=A0A6J4S227_9ACTN|nr:MAG: Putative glycosyltransferase [uncultured Solirubrobacteraceae bacterium]